MTQIVSARRDARAGIRRDHSLAVILFMMALVFAPAVGLHAAATFLGRTADGVASAAQETRQPARAPG